MKKKVCIFSGYFPLQQGGAEYQAYLLAEALKKNKYDVFFIMFSAQKKNMVIRDGYKIYSITPNMKLAKLGSPFFLYYFRIREILRKEKPDIVYRRMGAAIPGILGQLKKQQQFKLIWGCSSDINLDKIKLPHTPKIFNLIDDLFRVYGIKKADRIVVQTDYQKRLLKKNFHRESLIIPNFHPNNDTKINKGKTPVQILWIANYKKLKQPEIFIDLADTLQSIPYAKFVMIGREDHSSGRDRTNGSINNLKNIEHLGELPIEDVAKKLAEAHILVNTSLYEGFPNTFIQAWMNRVPVVSLNVDPDRMIKKNNIGFHSKSFQQLVKDTRALIEDRELREEMGCRAQKIAFEKFSIDKNMNTMLNLFEALTVH